MHRKLMEDISTHGWTDIGIFPTREDEGERFNYTVGMAEYDHPEMLVVGLENVQAHGVLASAYDLIRKGIRLEPNTFVAEIVRDYDIAVVKVDDPLDPATPFTLAMELYGEVKAIQLVWPDEKRRFPWDADYDHKLDHQLVQGTWEGP
jgi:hypothetical protein